MCRIPILLIVALALSVAAAPAVAGVSYADPPSGWRYIYPGVGAANPDAAALDGNWDHNNGSDGWDGSLIGAGQVGGIIGLTEGSTSFLRIQDALTSGSGTDSRKIYFGHSLTAAPNPMPQATADQILSVEGVTLSFRARLATTPPLDGTVPSTGDGYVIHDGGKGPFGVHQEAGGDQIISFGLVVAGDGSGEPKIAGRTGLCMNNLNGTAPSGNVDIQGNEAGTLNMLNIADLTVWHEFWITIQPDTSGGGTHLVKVWMDGSMVADEFDVTAGTGGDYTFSYVGMGMGATPQAGAIDVDFFAYKEGVHLPPGSQKKAYNPDPSDGERTRPDGVEGDGYWMLLQFAAGDGATTHTAYFSSNFDDVNDRSSAVSLGSPPYPGVYPTGYYVGLYDENIPEFAREPLDRGVVYYWAVDESNDTTTYPGDVWSFTIATQEAWNPTPADDEENVIGSPQLTLSWQMGDVDLEGKSLSYNIYWGTDEAAVAADTIPDAVASDETHVIGPLNGDTDYYWRVDAVLILNAPPFTQTVIGGAVWHFKTLFWVLPEDPDLVGWWKLDGGFGDLIFDWSGNANHGARVGDSQHVPGYIDNAIELNGIDQYVNIPNSTSLNLTSNFTVAAWIYVNDLSGGRGVVTKCEGTSDKQYILTLADGVLRFEYESSGNNYAFSGGTVTAGEWQHVAVTVDSSLLSNLYIDGASTGSETAPAEVAAQANPVVIGRWGGSYNNNYFDGMIDDARIYKRALSAGEMRLLAGRLNASNPNPGNGASDVSRTPTLSWTPGLFVAAVNGNILYYGDSAAAVANRTATNVTLTDATYALLPTLDLGETFYWAVDTVNGVDIWPGDVWSFTTTNWLLVDDMESYTPWTTPGNNIFEAYRDGLGNCEAGNGNDTGANLTENADPVFGGIQSMMYDYDNDGLVFNPCTLGQSARLYLYSKIEAQIAGLPDGIGTDWTIQGVKALSLRFQGLTTSDIEPMWVQLSDGTKAYGNKVTYGDYDDEDPADINDGAWHEWFIDMADFSVDLTNLVSLVIGFGTEGSATPGGSGTVYFDDFRLYTPRCFASRHTPEMAKLDFTGPAGVPDCLVGYHELDVMADDWLEGDSIVIAADPGNADLVARYEFTGNFNDSSANAIHGTANGGVFTSFDADLGEDVAVFDGIDDYVDLGNRTELDFGTGNWAIAAWIKPITTTNQHMVYCKGGDDTGGIRYMLTLAETNANMMTVTTDDNVNKYQRHGAIRVDDGEWHHVVGMRDGTALRVYVDGIYDGATTIPAGYDLSGTSQANAYIGANWSFADSEVQKFFHGSIDDLRVYSKALSQSEIAAVMGLTELYIPVGSPAEIYEGEDPGDRVINFKDYAELLSNWLAEVTYPQ